MPTYQYQCAACGHGWEELLSISEMDTPLKKPCPECKKKKVQKIIGSPAIVSGVAGSSSTRHSGAFKEVMAKVKKAHPKGNYKYVKS